MIQGPFPLTLPFPLALMLLRAWAAPDSGNGYDAIREDAYRMVWYGIPSCYFIED